MLKMLKLDWLAVKTYRAWMLLIPFWILYIGWFTSAIHLLPMCVFLFLTLAMNPFVVEEKGDLNRLYLTLPVKRRDVVAGRYVYSFIMLLCGLVSGMVLTPVVNLMSKSKWYPGFEWYLTIIALCFLYYALMCIFMFPPLFKLGYHKGKYIGFYVPAFVAGIAYGLFAVMSGYLQDGMFITNFLIYASENMLLVSGGMMILALAILYLSYYLSQRIYARREF